MPLRPIVSFINSPSYQLSKHPVSILSPLVGNSTSHVLNSTMFSDFICTQVLQDKTRLVSFDVVSLFKKVPIERAKEIAHGRLVNDTTLDDRTLLAFRGKFY